MWAKSQDITPHALTTGELRDHIFFLAQQADVKLQQIYVLPTGKGRLANAFASNNNNLLLSEYLLAKLNQREVDAIIAHELGHLKHQHPQKLTNITFWIHFIAGLIAAFLVIFFRIPIWLVFLFVWSSDIYFRNFFSRRFEHAADTEAVALSADPEACITAIFPGVMKQKLLQEPSILPPQKYNFYNS